MVNYLDVETFKDSTFSISPLNITMENKEDNKVLDEKPPFLQSWKQVYWLVLFIHSIIIFFFWWFTHSYS
ncbi:MAG: hypothetical protein KDC24_02970 [Saprospiraceae bacterium]|nr:hypothetical protein [Saprospiraceae bacterium]